MNRTVKLFALALCLCAALVSADARERTLHIVTTGDVHGSWFDEPYVGDRTNASLMSVYAYVDSLRNAVGKDNVLLLDAGDCLQGNNAAYYFNYVDKSGAPHLYSRLVEYMGYDAIVVGNHDIEAGHPVYDRVAAELAERGIPWLGGNALRTDNGEPYFPVYKIFNRAGLKVAVLGFTNPNMKAWLGEEQWKGIDFVSLIPYVQEWVDMVNEAEKPEVTVVVVHSGTGSGDGSAYESQGLDLLNSLHGANLIVTSHDHRPAVITGSEALLLNGGSHARRVGHAVITVDQRGKKQRFWNVKAEVVTLDPEKVDEGMKQEFAEDFKLVKDFTLKPIGKLGVELRSRDAYAGMSDYINLIHLVQLSVPGAQVSFAAPLSFNGVVKEGQVIFNDLFTIYPYENELCVLKLTGAELKNYLEYSYDNWIQTPGEHVLKIVERGDARTGASRWSFVGASFNFDSAAGLVYTVDVTKPYGSRVEIISLADGTEFDPEQWYHIAMTSYRANGGGDLLIKGAGIDKEKLDERVIARYPAIRDMVGAFIAGHEVITHELLSDPVILGEWKFIPESAVEMLEADMKLMF